MPIGTPPFRGIEPLGQRVHNERWRALGQAERDEGATGGLVRGGHDDLRFVGGSGLVVVRLT